MARKLSDILKDRTIFTEEQEKRILENVKKEIQDSLAKDESTPMGTLLEQIKEVISENN